MRQLDLVVIVVYLVAIARVGLRLSGRQKSAKDYFVGEGSTALVGGLASPWSPPRPAC